MINQDAMVAAASGGVSRGQKTSAPLTGIIAGCSEKAIELFAQIERLNAHFDPSEVEQPKVGNCPGGLLDQASEVHAMLSRCLDAMSALANKVV